MRAGIQRTFIKANTNDAPALRSPEFYSYLNRLTIIIIRGCRSAGVVPDANGSGNGAALIHCPVTVIVLTVTEFRCSGIDGIIIIIAICIIGHITKGLGSRRCAYIGITITVLVIIQVIGSGDGAIFINLAIAVVINAITTDFHSTRMYGSFRVITIRI